MKIKPKLKIGAFKCMSCGAVIKLNQKGDKITYPPLCFKEQGGCGRSLKNTKFELLIDKSEFEDIYEIIEKYAIEEEGVGLAG